MNYATKLAFLQRTLKNTEDGAHKHVIDMFLSMLAIDNLADWITPELIRGLQELEKDFPNCVHLNYCIHELKRQLSELPTIDKI